MNEYLKKINDDAKKYMPHGENGLMWTSGTWSENHVMKEKEKLEWDKWLNGVLISNESKVFNQNIFEDSILIYKRELPKKEHLSSLILYQKGEQFNIEPTALNSIINETCIQANKSQNCIWFHGEQGESYHYTINGFGPYNLKSLKTEAQFVNYEANLEPLFSNLINSEKHQTLKHNYQVLSGIVGVDKDWIILIQLRKQEEIIITISGDKSFCKLIETKIKPAANT